MVKMVYLFVLYTGNLRPSDSITIHGFPGLLHKTSRKEHSTFKRNEGRLQ